MPEKPRSYNEKLSALRAEMARNGVDAFLVPRGDEFQGEFVAPCAERLAWLTGFTGSAGMAIVLADRAVVMSDGRYTIQLGQQCDPALFETADSMVTGVGRWLGDVAPRGAVIGYDPWLHTPDHLAKIDQERAAQESGAEKQIVLKALESNLVDVVWRDRPEKPLGFVEIFPESIAGISFQNKKKIVAEKIAEVGAQACFFSLPDSISWLLNVRGADLECLPVVQSFALVFADPCQPVRWFVDARKISSAVKAHLGTDVEMSPPDNMLEDFLVLLKAHGTRNVTIQLDFSSVPQRVKAFCEESGWSVLNKKDPCIALKALKTQTEKRAIERAHLQDSVALAHFLYWLDREAPRGTLTECDVEARLLAFRQESPAFRDQSFSTIAGFAEHGAIVHYRATPDSNAQIIPSGLLLVDSGAQYGHGDIWGTTDITRTVAIGAPTREMQENFTRVLKGHIAVARARFPAGTCGQEIDALARKALQAVGLDYTHGTGHGVGCYLSVHEEAASLSPRGKTPLEAGMLLSNEPGYYKEGAYGIRIENLVFVVEAGDGLLGFETVSYAPIDQTLIVKEMLEADEAVWLDSYHHAVYERLAPLLGSPEKQWLLTATSVF